MFSIWMFASASGREPVTVFIRGEERKARDKIYEVIGYLRQYGLHLSTQYLRRLTGTKHLWELRVKYHRQYRIFFASVGEHDIVLLHAIVKKTQKTPEQDIRTAEERLQHYEIARRKGDL